jgi:hypothetical protein
VFRSSMHFKVRKDVISTSIAALNCGTAAPSLYSMTTVHFRAEFTIITGMQRGLPADGALQLKNFRCRLVWEGPYVPGFRNRPFQTGDKIIPVGVRVILERIGAAYWVCRDSHGRGCRVIRRNGKLRRFKQTGDPFHDFSQWHNR